MVSLIIISISSFGAMGATVRLSSLAFQGKTITTSFKTMVNVINGTSLGVNSVAVANSLAYMAIHYEEMSPIDVLMQVASVAFWAKSVFTYKPATKIVSEIHNQVLNNYSTNLGKTKDDFNNFRVKFNNDKQLVKFYSRFLKQGLDPAQVSDVLVEIYQMGAGAQFFHVDPAQLTVNINGHTFTMEFLMSVKSCNRQTVFKILSEMDEIETLAFNNLRSQLQDDIGLFFLIADVSKDFNLKADLTAHSFMKFWKDITDELAPPSIKINKDFTITIANGHTFNIDQIVELSTKDDILGMIKTCLIKLSTEETMKFNQLRVTFNIDSNNDEKFFDWITKAIKFEIGDVIKTLLELKALENNEFEFFELIKLENSESSLECGMVNIDQKFRTSIFFLHQLEIKHLNELIQMIKLSEIVNEKMHNFHERIGSFRVQCEFNRKTAMEWFDKVTKHFNRITSRYGKPHAFELTRLYHVKNLLSRYSHESELEIIKFVFALNPKNFIDFCSCCDFANSYLQNTIIKYTVELFKTWKAANPNEMITIRQWRGELTKLKFYSFYNINKIFLEQNVINDLKNNCRVSKLEFAKLQMNVNRNKMYEKNRMTLKDNPNNKDIVKSLTLKVKANNLVKFDSETVAVTQLYKRSKGDMRKFVERANLVIRDSKSKHFVKRDQEGVIKLIEFIDSNGRVEVMKQFENVNLTTFIEYDHHR